MGAARTALTAQQLFDALEREGVDPQEYREWRTHERDQATGQPFGPVNGVVIHHTAGSSSLALCYNGRSDLPGPLCHTHLSKAGEASMLSAGRANHAGNFAQNAHDAVVAQSSTHPAPSASEPVGANDKYYGLEIENLGNGTDPYPWVQYVKAVKWAAGILRAHGWDEDSGIGHKEGTTRKIDPKGPVFGPDGEIFTLTMNRFRADVRDALAAPAGVWPEEEDVALTDAEIEKIAERVWLKDGVIGNVLSPPSTNTHIVGATAVQNIEIVARRSEGKVDALAAKVDAISVGGVDLDALAAKVADLLAARLQS